MNIFNNTYISCAFQGERVNKRYYIEEYPGTGLKQAISVSFLLTRDPLLIFLNHF